MLEKCCNITLEVGKSINRLKRPYPHIRAHCEDLFHTLYCGTEAIIVAEYELSRVGRESIASFSDCGDDRNEPGSKLHRNE